MVEVWYSLNSSIAMKPASTKKGGNVAGEV